MGKCYLFMKAFTHVQHNIHKTQQQRHNLQDVYSEKQKWSRPRTRLHCITDKRQWICKLISSNASVECNDMPVSG